MANLLAEKLFTKYNLSLLRHHTINQYFFVRFIEFSEPTNLSFNRTFLFVNCLCIQTPPFFDIYVHKCAALTRDFNELCGPPVGLIWSALTYTKSIIQDRFICSPVIYLTG